MSTTTRVLQGDTASSIARRHACSVEDLQCINGIADPLAPIDGGVVLVPDARAPGHAQRAADRAMDPAVAAAAVGQMAAEGLSSPSPLVAASAGAYRVVLKRPAPDDGSENSMFLGVRVCHGLSSDVLVWLREIESTQCVIGSAKGSSERRQPGEQKRVVKASGAAESPAKRHKDEVLAELHQRLFAVPHVVTTAGMRLSRNERKMIVAAVGLCEINTDVFASSNRDQEFVGRWFGRRGAEERYSRIVHIGLSYGYIQFSQDGGGLGKLLTRMRDKDPLKFKSFFPNGAELIQMTNAGLPGHGAYGKSGQFYWNGLSKGAKAKLLVRANTDADEDQQPDDPLKPEEEIRGARVQKIPYVAGYPAIDLWEDYKEFAIDPVYQKKVNHLGYLSAFRAAGDVPAFQDVQLDLAVEDFMNPILAHCKDWNIRSALGLAFVTACSVHGGTRSGLVKLLSRVAHAKLSISRFESRAQERDCLQAIADATPAKKGTAAKVNGVTVDALESKRAGIILADEYHFLAEDLYDTSSYGADADV